MIRIFHRSEKKEQNSLSTQYSIEKYEPVIRSSVCTGEKTACMKDRETGKLHEVMLIKNPNDLKTFSEEFGIDPDKIKTIY